MTSARGFAELARTALLAAALAPLGCQSQQIPHSHVALVAPSASASSRPSPVLVQPRLESERDTQAIDWTEPMEPDHVEPALRLTRAAPALQAGPRCASLLGAAPTRARCDTLESAREQLAQALGEISSAVLEQERNAIECRNDAGSPRPRFAPQRKATIDARLRALESCVGLPAGFVRALRAELTLECADTLAENALASGMKLDAKYHHALLGLALAARFGRVGPKPPDFRPRANSLDAARPFVERTLLPWLKERDAVLSELEASASLLPEQSYGGALARVAAGLSRLAMHGAYRGVSIPIEFRKDYGLRTAFYSVVDEVFAPFVERETRARRAALRRLDVIGSIWLTDPLDVRPLLRDSSELLGKIALPQATPATADTTAARLALSLPGFYLPELLSDAELQSANVLRAALLRGLAPALRTRLRSRQSTSDVISALTRSELQAALLTSNPRRARRAALLAAGASDRALLLAIAQSLGSLPDALEAWDGQSPLPIDVGALTRFDAPEREEVGLSRLDAALLLSAARRFAEAEPLVGQVSLLPPPAADACGESVIGHSGVFRVRQCACIYMWSRPFEGQQSALTLR